jgi:hypothetical protein
MRKTTAQRIQSGELTPSTPYQKRIARGIARGFTVAQSRGHARTAKGELPVSVVKKSGVLGTKTDFFKGSKSTHRRYRFNSQEAMLSSIDSLKGNAKRVFARAEINLKGGTTKQIQSETMSTKQSTKALTGGIQGTLNGALNEYETDDDEPFVPDSFELVFVS